MNYRRLLAALLVVASFPVLGLPAGPAIAGPVAGQRPAVERQGIVRQISGSVGPSFTISMSRRGAHSGRYVVTVHDRSSQHNFHLIGPGDVDRKTAVPFTGTVRWHLRLRPGTYRFRCDPHRDVMHGQLRVFAG